MTIFDLLEKEEERWGTLFWAIFGRFDAVFHGYARAPIFGGAKNPIFYLFFWSFLVSFFHFWLESWCLIFHFFFVIFRFFGVTQKWPFLGHFWVIFGSFFGPVFIMYVFCMTLILRIFSGNLYKLSIFYQFLVIFCSIFVIFL